MSERLNALIGDIYEAGVDAARIQGVLDEMTWQAGADNGGLSISSATTGEALLFVFSPLGVVQDAEVLGMYQALEPWRRAVVLREPGRMYIDQEITLLHELTRSPAYQRWLQVSGNRSRSSGYLPLGADIIMYLGFARGQGKRPFARDDVRQIETLLPHFARATRINRLLNELTVMHDVAEERYGKLGVGVVLLNADQRVMYTSRAARRILGLGLGLELRNGLLACTSPPDQQVLERLIGAQARLAARPGLLGGESMTLTAAAGTTAPLSLMISPYQNRLETRTLLSTTSRVLVLLFDPSYRTPGREEALRQQYGMSDTEAVLAVALASGRSLVEIAGEHGLSKETLRSRLKRIFGKTGTRRQSELLRLLLASPALLEHRATVLAPGAGDSPGSA